MGLIDRDLIDAIAHDVGVSSNAGGDLLDRRGLLVRVGIEWEGGAVEREIPYTSDRDALVRALQDLVPGAIRNLVASIKEDLGRAR